jgi:hypothetical protein
MYVWRPLLHVLAQQSLQSGPLDSPFFERNQASQYYPQGQNRTVTTVKATTSEMYSHLEDGELADQAGEVFADVDSTKLDISSETESVTVVTLSTD